MGNTYSGQAQLIVDDTAIPVQALLQKQQERPGGLWSWHGTLESENADWFDLINRQTHLTLRLPSGEEGQLLVTHADVASPADPVDVEGSGPAPF